MRGDRSRNRLRQKETRARPDAAVPQNGAAKQERIDMGLAILATRRTPPEGWTLNDIAAFCGCSDEMIRKIQSRALAKLRSNPRTATIARELIGQIGSLE